MLLNMIKPRKQRGIGLLELMLSLAIISILLIMAVRYYKNANQAQKISNTLSIVGGIISAETQYAIFNSGSYTSDLKALNLPANILNSPWGGMATLDGGETNITLTFPSNVPGDVCTKILGPAIEGSGASYTCGGSGSAFGNLVVTYPGAPTL